MKKNAVALLKKLPSIDKLLQIGHVQEAVPHIAHKYLVRILREVVDSVRKEIIDEKRDFSDELELNAYLSSNIQIKIDSLVKPSLRRVINCTGVILHTGLGRAPFSRVAIENTKQILEGYCNLEFDLEEGERGERTDHVEYLLKVLTGAEAAAVVNNNAAAVLLALNSLADGKEVIISRGELIEIGGSFRIPEVMQKSGAIMREVGTTNKTHLHDYTKALNPNTGGLLVVHTSNYRVQGFTAQIELSDAVRIARENNLFVLHDLGGGILLDFESIGLPKEPLVSESIEKGADIVTFSGDKVIGGPQCGILVGKKEAIAKIRKNPLMRALRCDKITYSLLGSTLQIFLQENKSVNNHLVLSQFTTPVEDVQKRAELLLSSLTEVGFDNFSFSIEKANAQAGSGTLPLEKLPSYALVIKSKTNINNLAKTLRTSNPAIIGYLNSDKLFLDMRSCLQVDLTDLISVLHTTLKELNY